MDAKWTFFFIFWYIYLNPSLDNGEPVEQIVFNLFNLYLNFKLGKDYPFPLGKHEEARVKALNAFKKI